VTRANPPDIYYPIPPTVSISTPAYSIWEYIKSRLRTWMSRVLVGGFNWWKPVRISRWLHHDKNYGGFAILLDGHDLKYTLGSLFKRIRFMTAGHSVPLKLLNGASKNSSPYQIFFNLYKPSTPFKKSAPPPPDFQVVVIKLVVFLYLFSGLTF
jgi:tRNA-splicing endonuclease subunit Sen54